MSYTISDFYNAASSCIIQNSGIILREHSKHTYTTFMLIRGQKTIKDDDKYEIQCCLGDGICIEGVKLL